METDRECRVKSMTAKDAHAWVVRNQTLERSVTDVLPPNDTGRGLDRRTILVLDFTDHPELYAKLQDLARRECRTVEMQALWLIAKAGYQAKVL